MNFKRMLDLRESKDLRQIDIAKIIGVSQQNYSLWEQGIKIIPLKHLHTLANYYQVSIDYIVGLSNDKQKIIGKEPNKTIISQNLKQLRSKYKLTLRALAQKLNTTSSTISAYEKGKTLILTAFLYQICSEYNLSTDKFIGRLEIKEKVII